jgi:hypothetical protein
MEKHNYFQSLYYPTNAHNVLSSMAAYYVAMALTTSARRYINTEPSL